MKRFEAKYLGIAFGIITTLLYSLTLSNILMSGKDYIYAKIIPFIPFLENISFITIIAGIFVAFLWGFFLGYLLIVIYNFYYKKFSVNNNSN